MKINEKKLTLKYRAKTFYFAYLFLPTKIKKDIENLYEICLNYKRLGIEIGNDNFCKKYHNNTFYRAYSLYQVTDKLDNLFQQNSHILNFARSVGINIIQKNNYIKNAISDFAMGFN